MHKLWLLAFAQVASAAALRVTRHREASALAVTLALAIVGWLLGERRGQDR